MATDARELTETAEPSDIVWSWRQNADPDTARARSAAEAMAARQRGLIQAAVGFAAALALGLLWRPVAGYVVAGVTLALLGIALAFPLTLHKQIQRGLQAFGHFVGMAVTWVLMTLLYLVLFLPVGLVLRATGKLGITTGPDPRAATYWKTPDPARHTPAQYRKQF
ncbi:MAG TPA: hypothetical protein VEG34_06445 [Thermoanaerobaculia bacterium]|nr:hypothetical protein [Thermoanaerobaculia bacterium]